MTIDTKNLRTQYAAQLKDLRDGQDYDYGSGIPCDMSCAMDDAADSIEALLDALERKDLLIANLTSDEEHSHKCVSCGYRYTPPDANEDCPICAGDGTPPVREPLSDEQRHLLLLRIGCNAGSYEMAIAKAVEAAIKEQK